MGWAGGDDDGGGDGRSYVLIANIYAGGRRFLVASGWGWRRALDAQEADYVRAEDTVVPHEDYQALDSVNQRGFRQLDTRFYRAPYSALEQAEKDKKNALAKSESSARVAPNIYVPSPKPYASR